MLYNGAIVMHQGNFEFVVRPTRPVMRRPVGPVPRRPVFQYSAQPAVAAALPQPVEPVDTLRRSKAPFVIVASLLVLGLGAGFLFLRPSPSKSHGVVNAESTTKESEEPAQPIKQVPTINEQQITSDVNAIIAAHPELDISVSYTDLTTGQSLHYGVTEHYVAASISKLMTAVLFLKQVDQGTRTMQTKVGGSPAEDQLKLLIEQSDNTAWANFNKLLGSANFNALATEIGMKDYEHKSNITTSDDVALLLSKLYKGELLSDSSKDILMGHMKAANYRQYIVDALPSSVTVYHKAGYLSDRAHDAAIVDNGTFPYVLVIFTKARNSSYDFVQGPEIIGSLTKAVNQTYQTSSPADTTPQLNVR